MNDVFCFGRFWRLVLKNWNENASFYLLYTLAVLGLILLMHAIWLFLDNNSPSEKDLYTVTLVPLYLSGLLFANQQFDWLHRKDKSIYWLSFPASHLEKLACAIFYTFIVFNLVFLICFSLVKPLTVEYITSYLVEDGATWSPLEPDFLANTYYRFIYIFLGLQALYLLGAVYFRRRSFLKTTFAVILLIFAFAAYGNALSEHALGPGFNWNLLTVGQYVAEPNEEGVFHYRTYTTPSWLSTIIICLSKYGFAPALWLITWRRLKEREI